MKEKYNYYNKELKFNARKLRSESLSKAEKVIWKMVLCKGMSGTKFKRQRPIENYIVDFFSAEIKLIIEIDGNSHLNKSTEDFIRQKRLENLGYTFLRIKEGEVLGNLAEVTSRIVYAVQALKED